jgi:CRP-like cAMP-binding protein/Fe-S-cluster-containing dehydrogenase component/ferredoxin
MSQAARPESKPQLTIPPGAKTVKVNIDGKDITVPEGTTIWEAAQATGVDIPVLCHKPGLKPVGVCRVCTVEVKGARVFAASCVRACENNMEIKTTSDRLERDRKTLIELLLADHPTPCDKHKESHSCELEILAEKMAIKEPIFKHRARTEAETCHDPAVPLDISTWLFSKGQDPSNPSIAIDHSACVVCDRCVRACTEIKHNNVIGRMSKGYKTSISFDVNKPMGNSSCVNCGECMVSCPTGAITSKDVAGTRLPTGEPLTVQQMLQIPIFQGISSEFLKRNQGGVVLRRYKKGEIICQEGEFGSTAFYMLKGKCEVYINTPMAHVSSDKTDGGVLQKFKHGLTGRKGSGTEPEQRYVRIDAPIDLPLDNPIAMLQESDLFGEMTCMNFLPRSATVRAAEDCELLEMLRNVLHMLQKNPKFKKQLEKNYRERALTQHLRSVPILSGLDEKFITQLRDRVDLEHFDAGEAIVKQGDTADAFYLVRVGCIRVSQDHPGGEMVITYLGRGEYFGEMGLLKGGKRTATCTALDHVEVVKIKKADFDFMLSWFEDLRGKFEAEAKKREAATKAMAERAPSVPLDDFLGQGLMHAQSLLLLDLEKCTRCDECVRACADAHDGVTRLVREGLRFDRYLVPTSCRSCMDPYCMVGCPVGSIRRKETMEVLIEDWCIGCGLCAQQCPYGNISMHSFTVQVEDPAAKGTKKAMVKEKAVLCDLCTELSEPSCVYACPHDAAHRVNARQYFMERKVGE